MLITDQYRQQNAELHRRREDYGTNGHRHAGLVRELAAKVGAKTVLDYGCGKGTLADALEDSDLAVREYDPAVPGKDQPPVRSDIVACTDVLEHIEPECLDLVLDDIAALTAKAALLVVHTGPAKKFLPDGRNAHLTQQPPNWWLRKLADRMQIMQFVVVEHGFIAVCAPNG